MEELKTYYLMDTDLNIIDLIETYESMIWTHRYWEAGDFELYLPATEKTMNMFTDAAKKNYYILRDGDDLPLTQKSVMIISKVVSETDVENGKHLSITGYSVKSLLSKRIVQKNCILAGSIESELRRIVDENAINPDSQNRVIPYLELGAEAGLTEMINYDAEGSQLDTVISTICKLFKVGWDIVFNMERKKFEFILYKGVDRSYAQSPILDKTPYVIFSDDFENLLTTRYTVDTTSYKNIAYVKGEVREYDEDKKDYITTDLTQEVVPDNKDNVITNPSGLDRREIFVDGSSDYSSYDESGQAQSINLNYYRELLVDKGKTELDKYKSTTDISGKVLPNYTFEINKDYFLGDLVTVQNSYGQSFDARVTEVIYTEEAKGITTIPSFIVENFDGKEQDDINIDPEKVLYTEETPHKAMTVESGGIMRVEYGYKEEDAEVVVTDPNTGKLVRLKHTTENGQQLEHVLLDKPKKNT